MVTFDFSLCFSFGKKKKCQTETPTIGQFLSSAHDIVSTISATVSNSTLINYNTALRSLTAFCQDNVSNRHMTADTMADYQQ